MIKELFHINEKNKEKYYVPEQYCVIIEYCNGKLEKHLCSNTGHAKYLMRSYKLNFEKINKAIETNKEINSWKREDIQLSANDIKLIEYIKTMPDGYLFDDLMNYPIGFYLSLFKYRFRFLNYSFWWSVPLSLDF